MKLETELAEIEEDLKAKASKLSELAASQTDARKGPAGRGGEEERKSKQA